MTEPRLPTFCSIIYVALQKDATPELQHVSDHAFFGPEREVAAIHDHYPIRLSMQPAAKQPGMPGGGILLHEHRNCCAQTVCA